MRSRALAAAAAVAILAGAASCAAARVGPPAANEGGSALQCHNTTSKAECLGINACVFCQASLVPSGCFLDSEAKLLPGFMYNCTGQPSLTKKKPDPAPYPGPQPGPMPGGGCPTHMDKKECRKSDDKCSWCESMFGQGACYSEDSAKFLPAGFFKCSGKKAAEQLEGKKGAKGKGDEPAECKDIKERKECRKSKAVCSWCEGKFGPGQAMCIDEAQAKFLPDMVFKCEASKVDPSDKGDDEADESLVASLAGGLKRALIKDAGWLSGFAKGGGDKPAPGGGGCRDIKERKECRKSKDVCSWCEGKFGPGQAMCVDEAQAKYLPPTAFTCEGSKVDPDAADELQGKKGHSKKRHDDDDDDDKKKEKEECKDLKERKGCRKSKALCSWCEGAFAPGMDMCIDEAQAKFLPPMVYSCEGSKRSKKADRDADCRSIAARGDCRRADAGCFWCEGKFGFPAGMCVDESSAKFLPEVAFECAPPKGKRAADAAAVVTPLPGPADACSEAETKKACGQGCRWCSGPMVEGQCFSEARAKLLPSVLFKCGKEAEEQPVLAVA